MDPNVLQGVIGEPCTLLFPTKPIVIPHLWGHMVAQLVEALR